MIVRSSPANLKSSAQPVNVQGFLIDTKDTEPAYTRQVVRFFFVSVHSQGSQRASRERENLHELWQEQPGRRRRAHGAQSPEGQGAQ
jgi:hypothetical protein